MGWGGRGPSHQDPKDTLLALPPPQLFCFVPASEGAFNWGGGGSAVKIALENQFRKE